MRNVVIQPHTNKPEARSTRPALSVASFRSGLGLTKGILSFLSVGLKIFMHERAITLQVHAAGLQIMNIYLAVAG